jgi:hypothetical protein
VLEVNARFFEGYLQQPMSAGLAKFLPIGSGRTSSVIEVSIGQFGSGSGGSLPITC